MTFDIRQLMAFSAVEKHGGFSRAAREVGITQPTLSSHVANLEKCLGVKLFDRSGRTVDLTPAGSVFFPYSQKILDLCDQSVQAVLAFTGEIRGNVGLAASTVPGEYMLPRWLGRFHQECPDVRVILTISDSQEVMRKVQNGDVHIGVSGTPASQPSLESHPLCDDEVILVASPEVLRASGISPPVNLSDLGDLNLINRESGSGTRVTVEKAISESGVNPFGQRWVATMGSTRAVIEGALARIGGAFLSRRTVQKELSNGSLVEIKIKDFEMKRCFYIITPSSRTLSPVAQHLLERLKETGGAF